MLGTELKTGQLENQENKPIFSDSGNDATKLKNLLNLHPFNTDIFALEKLNYVKYKGCKKIKTENHFFIFLAHFH